jgi:hypothetical protein
MINQYRCETDQGVMASLRLIGQHGYHPCINDVLCLLKSLRRKSRVSARCGSISLADKYMHFAFSQIAKTPRFYALLCPLDRLDSGIMSSNIYPWI